MIKIKKMNWFTKYGFVFFFSFIYSFSHGQSNEIAIDATQLQDFLKEAQGQIGMPAVSCAIIRDNKVLFKYEQGFANLEHSVKVTDQTVYPLYSLTKPFIAVGVFSLIEEGKLNLDDLISTYVLDIPAEWKKVKIKHLLTHSSGLPDMVGKNPYELRDLNESEAKERVYALPLRFDPGMKYEYNQTNFWLLKKIIERVSGVGLSKFIISNQFPNSTFDNVFFSSDAREIVKNRATPYFPWIKGKLMIDLTYTNGDYFYACNGFHLTLDEFIAWNLRLKGNELISKASKKQMWQLFPYLDSDKSFTYGWEATKVKKKQAYGFSGAMSTFYRIYPKENLSIIFLSNGFTNMYNQDAFADTLVEMILK